MQHETNLESRVQTLERQVQSITSGKLIVDMLDAIAESKLHERIDELDLHVQEELKNFSDKLEEVTISQQRLSRELFLEIGEITGKMHEYTSMLNRHTETLKLFNENFSVLQKEHNSVILAVSRLIKQLE